MRPRGPYWQAVGLICGLILILVVIGPWIHGFPQWAKQVALGVCIAALLSAVTLALFNDKTEDEQEKK
jgi:predicted ribosomally synthesized peptide with SipW-like signal peptide